MVNVKDGDIYTWKYKNDLEYCEKHRGSGTAYWCLDQQCYATIRDGVTYLVDTYWSDYGSEYLGNVTYVDIDKVDLEFVCNLNDVEFIADYYVQDYDKVYNLSRQKHCYKKYAIDKGSEVSNKALLVKYVKEYNDLLSQKEYIESRLLSLSDKIDELESE